MTFSELLEKPASKKITIVEIDTPIHLRWNNYQEGIWFAFVPSSKVTDIDDYGNIAYLGDDNSMNYNFNSLAVNNELYDEVTSLTDLIALNESWYYEGDKIYIHLDQFEPPCVFRLISAGAVIGFTNQVDTTCNNYFEDIYYEPLITSIPNLSKTKDALRFGLAQYRGGQVSFDNTGGYFDDFAKRDLYGQPVRIKLSFEGLPYDQSKLVYSGRVGEFSHDLQKFNLAVEDPRKFLGRKLPVRTFNSTDYPNIETKLIGSPIPIIYGNVINVPATKVASGQWVFADTTIRNIDSGITVIDKDGNTFAHTGTGEDGTFTGTDTKTKLYVTCSQSTVKNGLDVIVDIIDNYEGITYNSYHYNTADWEAERVNIKDVGVWIGKGNLYTTRDLIESICTDNQGIFDIVNDKFTYRSYDPERMPNFEIFEDELLDDPEVTYDTKEYLSSAIVLYSKDYLARDYQSYTNDTYENEVYGRYRNFKTTEGDGLETLLSNTTDAQELSEKIMESSKLIKPKVTITTKTQNSGIQLLDNILFTCKRQSGKEIIARSLYQVLGVTMDLVNYEVTLDLKQIREDNYDYGGIVDGGSALTGFDYYDGGTATTDYNYFDGGDSL